MIRDEDFYGAAAEELAVGDVDKSIMAKAYALAIGDGEKTKALYIGFRADQFKEQAAAALAEAEIHRRAQEQVDQLKQKQQIADAKAEEKRRKLEEKEERKRDLEEKAAKASRTFSHLNFDENPYIIPTPIPSVNSASEKENPPPSNKSLEELIKGMKEAGSSKLFGS